MSDMDNYRTSKEYREILRILQKSATLHENILWQSHTLGKNIIPVQFLEIDFIARELVVTFNSQHYRIDDDLPLYVKLSYRETVFKITSFKQGQNSVFFTFPELIKTEELRLTPRHTFKPLQEKYVTLRSTMNDVTKDAGNELKVRVMDISATGLGLVVSEQNRSFLKNNRVLWLTGLQDMKLVYPILAEVVYINSEVDPKFVIKKQKSIKVGLKISGSFNPEIYNLFLL